MRAVALLEELAVNSSQPDKSEPHVSIVLVVGDRRHRSSRALRSALAQGGIDRAELVLVDAGSPEVPPLPGSDDERVSVLRPALSMGFGALKAAGVRRARAPIVAFMEDHVELRPGWLEGILQAAGDPWSALGAEVHNANPGVGLGDVVGLINYGLWSPPLARGEMEMLAGNNSIYRRELLLQRGEQLEKLLTSDTVLQMWLAKEGHRLLAEPSISISHRNPTTLLSSVKAEFLYHWCFAAVRAEVMEWSLAKRIAYLLGSPLIPWLRLYRLYRLLRERFQLPLHQTLRTLLVGVILLHASVVAQAGGLVFGVGRMEALFTDFELNGRRPMADEL